MRLPNSYGSISKLSGNRRKKYIVRKTVSMTFDEETMTYKQKQKVIGYFATRAEAIKALADYNDNPFDLDAQDVTFAELYERIKPEIPTASIRNYQAAFRYLSPIAQMPLKSIKLAHMQKCIDDCETTQKTMIKTVCKRVYKYALIHELTNKDQSQYLKAESKKAEIVRNVFTAEEMAFLWDNTDKWWVVVTLILLYTGMRTKELRTLTEDNINYDARWLDIQFGKNECSVRGIPIHKRILPLFRAYFCAGGNLYGYAHSTLNQNLNRLNKHKAHDARHSFASRMREIGVDHLVIKRLLGHTPDDITERIYTHLSREELTAAIDQLEY